MDHPLQKLPAAAQHRLFYLLLGLTILLIVVMQWIGAPLSNPTAPYGIVSFELAGTPEKAQAIIAAWDAQAVLRAAFQTGLDYLFLLVYSTALASGVLWSGAVLKRTLWPLAGIAVPLAWGAWLAAGLDFIENCAMMSILLHQVKSPLPEVAAICAVLKFTLIFLGLVYAFYGLVVGLVGRATRK